METIIKKIGLLVVIFLCSLYVQAQCEYEEKNGLVIIEAENTTSDYGEWILKTDVADYKGSGHLEFTGNTTSNGPAGSPLTYSFKINQGGMYQLTLRGRKRITPPDESDKSNDCYVRVEGDYDASPDAGDNHNDDAPKSALENDMKIFGGNEDSWGWAASLDLGGDTNKRFPKYVFKAGETYTLVMSGRSKQFNVDRIIFYRLEDYSTNNARNAQNTLEETICEQEAPVTPENVTLSGELKRWHKITLDFEGPNTSETASTNPFSNYRLDVTFTNGAKSYTVPGFYSGCSNPEDTSCDSGNIWRVHFAPDRTGTWNWSASFKTGTDVAVNGGGSSTSFDGDSGSFVVSESDKTGRDFRSANLGRLQYVGEHYLKHSGTTPDNPNGPWFVKAGADSPENAFAYEDFDNTPNRESRRKSWEPHQQDYNASDASDYTWDSGKGSELLGVVNYLSSEGANAMSFLTFSLGGDDENVFPHLLKVSESVYNGYDDPEQWSDGVHKDRFDVSKLAQWEKIFEYADKKGMYLHFKTMETENDNFMDSNENGRERKLYYRELIARFGHHLALNWNLTEETTLDDDVAIDVTEYIHAVDPYDHNIVIHTYPGQKTQRYTPLLGNNSELTGASLQSNSDDVHDDVIEWLEKSKNAGKKWVVANDEQGPARVGVRIDDEDIREKVLYGTLMAGGAGVEYYYGYTANDGDLFNQNHRLRGVAYEEAGYALKFFQEYFNDYLIDAESNDGLTSDNDDYVLANEGKAYAVYLPNGGSTSLSLPSGNGNYNVQWYNPRSGDLGSASTLGNTLSAPDSNNDWVALIINNGDDPIIIEENKAPEVSVTTPASNLTVKEGEDVALEATATDSDGTITQVEFFVNGNSFKVERVIPYTGTLSGYAAGIYVITAVATDNEGATTTSSAVTITIENEDQPVTDAITIPGSFEAEAYSSIAGTIRTEDTPGTTGENLGYIKNNDTAEYAINVAQSGAYVFNIYASSKGAGGTVNIYSDNALVGAVEVPVNGAWHDYQVFDTTANLSAGEQTLKFVFNDASNGYLINVDKVVVTKDATAVAETAELSPVNDAYLQGNTRYNVNNIRIENGNRVGYLMFDLSNIEGAIETLDLQFTVFSDIGNGNVNVNLGTSNGWTETNLSSTNKPGTGVLLGSLNTNYSLGSVYTVSLDASKVTGDVLTLVLTATSGNDFDFGSKENSSTTGPQLLINDNTANKGITVTSGRTIEVYPNPTVDVINFKGNVEGAVIKIYDLLGALQTKVTLANGQSSLNMNEMIPGVYLVNITNVTDGQLISEIIKVVKQ